MTWNKPKKCPNCLNFTKKADGQGYDGITDEHSSFRLGRICERCKIVYLNPNYSEYQIVRNSEVGR